MSEEKISPEGGKKKPGARESTPGQRVFVEEETKHLTGDAQIIASRAGIRCVFMHIT